jgi:hypothetical protein
MVNNVIRVVNYVIAAPPSLLNFMIADMLTRPVARGPAARYMGGDRGPWSAAGRAGPAAGHISGFQVSYTGNTG